MVIPTSSAIAPHGPLIFAPAATAALGAAVAAALGAALSPLEEREFEDGEHKARPLVSVRGRDAYVVQSLHGDARGSVNDKLCRLLFLIATLKDASAERVTAVVPYFAYARKDRRTQPRDPVTMQYVARLLEAMGLDRIVAFEAHNLAAFQNAFRCRAEHLDARVPLFAALEHRFAADAVVVSPDAGGMKRAEGFRTLLAQRRGLNAELAFLEKHRALGKVSGSLMAGDVRGKTVVIYDDLISTGGTMLRAAQACQAGGAAKIYVAAAHGLFGPGAERLLNEPAIERILVTNSVPSAMHERSAKLEIVDCAPFLAKAIGLLHQDGSMTDLLAGSFLA